MCNNYLTILDPGMLGTGRGQSWMCSLTNWDPRLFENLEAMSYAGNMIALTDPAMRHPKPHQRLRRCRRPGVRLRWAPDEWPRAWHKGPCMDLAEHSSAISAGFYAYLLGNISLLGNLTGTRRTLARYLEQTDAVLQICTAIICFTEINKNWDQNFDQEK